MSIPTRSLISIGFTLTLAATALVGGLRLAYAQPTDAASASQFEFAGQVLDPDGKPFSGARVYLVCLGPQRDSPPKLRTTSDSDGRFRFRMEKSELDALRPQWRVSEVDIDYSTDTRLLAMADGCGPMWLPAYAFDASGEVRELMRKEYPQQSGLLDEKVSPVLRLVRDDAPIQGRIVDQAGRPIAGVKVGVTVLQRARNEDLTDWLNSLQAKDASMIDCWINHIASVRHLGIPGKDCLTNHECVSLLPVVVSDKDGKFQIQGLGRERMVGLCVEGERIVTSGTLVRTRPGPVLHVSELLPYAPYKSQTSYGSVFEYVVRPSVPIIGTVRDKETGKPLSGVTVQSHLCVAENLDTYIARDSLRTTTDAQGRYRLTGMRVGKNVEMAAVTADQPYLFCHKANLEVPADKESVRVDFELQRGVWIRGTITDAVSGKPIPCSVEYRAMRANPHFKGISGFDCPNFEIRWFNNDRLGRYSIAGLPGRGLVVVMATGDTTAYPKGAGAEKIPELKDDDGAASLAPYIVSPEMCNAVAEVNPAEGAESHRLDIQLHPGRTIPGTILDPEGKPLSGAMACGLRENEGWRLLDSPEFTVEGYRPEKPRELLFMHRDRKLSGRLMVEGREPAAQRVQLAPWGAIAGRVVDSEGRPKAGLRLTAEEGRLPMYLWQRDSEGYLHVQQLVFRTDPDGRFGIEGLSPGVKYSLRAWEERLAAHEFGVESGQTNDIGDLKLEPKKSPGR